MRPNKDRRTEIILYGLLLIPLLFTAAALAQATEQAQGLAEITAVLSEILHTPSMLRWCASTPKFLLAVLVLYPLAVYCYMLDQADRHPGAEHGTAKWGSAHRLNIKYRNTKDTKENYILTENVRFSTDSHAHKHIQKGRPDSGGVHPDPMPVCRVRSKKKISLPTRQPLGQGKNPEYDMEKGNDDACQQREIQPLASKTALQLKT